MSSEKINIIMDYQGKRVRLSKGALDVIGKQGNIQLLMDISGNKLLIKPSKEILGIYSVPASEKEFLECEEIIEEIWRLNRSMRYGRKYMVEGRLDSQSKELVFNLLKAVEVPHEEMEQEQGYAIEIKMRQKYIDHALAVLCNENVDLKCLKIYDLKTEALSLLRGISSWDWAFGEENGNILDVMEQKDREKVLGKCQTIKNELKMLIEILSSYEITPYKEKKEP